MPWKECSPMSERREFVGLLSRGAIAHSRLCKRYGVSRKTGYKWLKRYAEAGTEGLADRSRRPHRCPWSTSPSVEQQVLGVRADHPWGGRKIRRYLLRHGATEVPAASTITQILRRHGCVGEEASRAREPLVRFERELPNELWQVDYKGHFATAMGRCHPLSVLDDHSRYCLCLDAHKYERRAPVQQSLTTAFTRYGLPLQMNFDNAPPWGTEARPGLSRLAVWLIRLGIRVSFSRPAHPQTNGKDERFHRTLKAEVLQARFFRSCMEAQKAFSEWRVLYNFERPHESLDGLPPACRYQLSPRAYPSVLPPIEYADADTIRHVRHDGTIKFHGKYHYASEALRGLTVAIRPTLTDGVWEVYFVRQKLFTIHLNESAS